MNKKSSDRSTYSNFSSSAVLTEKNLRVAIEALKEASKQPFISRIKSRYEWWRLMEESNTARNFSLYGGIPCVKDSSIPANIARIEMSDGTYQDIEISKRPDFMPVFRSSKW